MKKIIHILAAAAITCGCNNSNKPPMESKIYIENLDTTVNPGDNFFQYAAGGWMKNNPLTAEYARFGQFDALAEKNREQLKELILKQAENKDNNNPEAKKIGDLYNLVMDSARRGTEGYTPIKILLNETAAIQNREEILPYMAKLMREGISGYFNVYIGSDIMDSKNNLLQIYQGGLSLPEKEYYSDSDTTGEEIREKFRKHVVKMFVLCGFDNETATKKMEQVMGIEERIASKSYDKVLQRDPSSNYHKKSYDNLKTEFNELPWDLFFSNLGIENIKDINIAQPEPLEEVQDIILNSPIENQIAYLQWNIINSTASELSDEIGEQNFDFYGRTLTGTPEQRPRWKRAIGAVNGALGEAIGQLYVAKYFPPQAKERMLELVKNLQTALGERIDAQEWMSDSTKALAHEKLGTFYVKIGYPDKWKDYSNLVIDPNDSYSTNCRRISQFMWSDMVERKHNKPVNRDEWYMTPQTVNAYYNSTTNEICFPAGILQYPFFDMNADDAFNYGAIGVVIGHEMTHGFDDKGRRFDKNGNLTDWWTKEDAEKFTSLTDIIINHFNAINVLPDLKANGQLTVGENIADHGGITISLQAFKNANGEQLTVENGFTPIQRFFLSYSNVWAGNIRDEEIRNRTKSDPHSLSCWRVNGTLPHIKEWYEAFNVKEKDSLFIPENERLTIW